VSLFETEEEHPLFSLSPATHEENAVFSTVMEAVVVKKEEIMAE
jgi:hypothetical protein